MNKIIFNKVKELFEKIKQKIEYAMMYLVFLYSTDERGWKPDDQNKRAYFIAWIAETSIGALIFFVMFGSIAMSQFMAISTAGWGTYAILLWPFLPLVCIAAFIIRVIRSAQEGFVGPISGARW